MEFKFIDSQIDQEEVLDRISDCTWVALDTEADSLHHYFEKICLIQISVDKHHYLIDPFSKIQLSSILNSIFSKKLILHAAYNDLRLFYSRSGLEPQEAVFDTMLAAQLLGFEKLGYDVLINHFYQINLKKTYQKANWSQRPLPVKLLEYAYHDTLYLESLAEILRQKLRDKGRLEWHRESCLHLVDAVKTESDRDPDQVWRIKYISKLSPWQLLLVRAIWFWRDKLARQADLPAFRILDNAALLNLALWVADHPHQPLMDYTDNWKHLTGVRFQELEQSVQSALSTPETDWPHKNQRGPKLAAVTGLSRLQRACREIADRLEIAPPVLAPKKSLELLARFKPRSKEDIQKCSPLLGWQAELLEPVVRKIW